jgi:hypothetical protein
MLDVGGQPQSGNAQQGTIASPTAGPLLTGAPPPTVPGLPATDSPQTSPSLLALGPAFATPPVDFGPAPAPGVPPATPAVPTVADLKMLNGFVQDAMAAPGGTSPEALKILMDSVTSQLSTQPPNDKGSESASVASKATPSDRPVSTSKATGSDTSPLGASASTAVTLPLNPAPTIFDVAPSKRVSPN